MARDSERLSDSVSRRKFIGGASVVGVAGLAGCQGTGGQGTEEPEGNGEDPEPTEDDSEDDEELGSLSADGSSTVYPITSRAGSLWNSNPPASDEEYWGPDQYGIDTDEPLADYWAGLFGFEPKGEGVPPFETSIGLNHTGVGLEKLEQGLVDIGDASAPVSAEFPDRSESELEPFTDHVVGVDAQPILCSRTVRDNLESITIEDVQSIYRGEIENWSEVEGYGGDDLEILAVGRAVGSGTDTSFRSNVLGDPDADMGGVDDRRGENQQVRTLVEQTDNAIAYAGLAFVTDQAPVLPLEIEGTVYTTENMSDPGYPLARDLHTYTWEGTSDQEAAFIRMLIHDYGQAMFVEPADYLPLTDERQEEELSKLPEPTN